MRKPTSRFNFTKAAIESQEIPSSRVQHRDTRVPELGLRVDPSGRKSFFWLKKARGEAQFQIIGTFPTTTVEQARGRAKELSGKLNKWKLNDWAGANPVKPLPARSEGDELTFEALLEIYITGRLKRPGAKNPERAEAKTREAVDRYLSALKGRRLDAIRWEDVNGVHARITAAGHATTANRVLQLVHAVFNYGLRKRLWSGANPATGIEKNEETGRERFLQPEELPKFFAELEKEETPPDLRDFVWLALMTGARKSDILSMRWADVSLADARWDVPITTKGKPYAIALVPEAVTILKERLPFRRDDVPWVFPSWSGCGHVVDLKRSWRELLVRVGIKDLRQHDLRRTLGSWQAARGTSETIIGKSLGHRPGSGATHVYSRLNLAPVRESVRAATQAMIAAMKDPAKLLPENKSEAAGE